MADIKSKIILEGQNKTQKSFNEVQKSMGRLEKNTLKSSQAFSRLQGVILGAVAAVGTFKLGKAFLNTAVEVENLSIQLKFLTGSAEEGSKAFETLTKFAGTVPFELQQIANAAPNLLTVVDGADELNEVLKITGDIAAATGLDFKTTAEQLQRAFSGGIAAADIFREKGIKSLLGFEEGVRFSAEQTKQHIMGAFRDGSAVMIGASGEMANTFTGTMSMMNDKLFQFQKKLMESGPFDFIKQMMKAVDTALTKNFDNIEDAAEFMGQKIVNAMKAGIIGLAKFGDMITPIVKLAVNAVGGLVDMVNGLPNTIKTLGILGFLMLGIKGKLVVMAIGLAFNKIRLLFADFMDFMAKGKKKIAGLMDALGFDEYAKSLRVNAKEIEEANKKMRDSINGTKDSIGTDTEEIIISMGKFGDITKKEMAEAGPFVQAVTHFFKDLEQQMKATANMGYIDPIIKEAARMKGIEAAKTAEVEKQAQLQVFIAQQMAAKKLAFKQMEFNGVKKFEERQAKLQIFLMEQQNKKRLDFNKKVAEAEKAFNENRTSALKSYTDGFKAEMNNQQTVFEQLQQAGANAFNGMADALTNFVMTGKFKFKDFANMVIRELVRIAIQAAITFALKKLAGSFFGIPFLAEGGVAQAGKPHIVGEEGPELFVPGQTGRVIPNDQITKTSGSSVGGKAVTVNFQVTALDADSFADKLAETRDTIVGIVNEAVTDGGRSPITA